MITDYLVCCAIAINACAASEITGEKEEQRGSRRRATVIDSHNSQIIQSSLLSKIDVTSYFNLHKGVITLVKDKEGGLQYFNTVVEVRGEPESSYAWIHTTLAMLIKAEGTSCLYTFLDPQKKNRDLILRLITKYKAANLPQMEGKEVLFRLTDKKTKLADDYYTFVEIQ